MTAYEIVTLTIAGLGGICMPVLILMLARQDKHREQHFTMIHTRIDGMHKRMDEVRDGVGHIDECVDDLKVRVLSATATRADLDAARAEFRESIDGLSAKISADTNGLHQRIFRLEDQAFGKRVAAS